MSPEDVFHVIGLTCNDILSGADFRILGLSECVLKDMVLLNQEFGPLRSAIQRGVLIEEQGEVLFLFDAMDFEGAQNYRRQFGEQYDDLKFFNDVAFRLCRHYGIKLPPVLGTITRSELPHEQYLGVSMRFRNVRPKTS